ncbi:MAG: DUF120 domain-containing protein, partial [Candidatus Hadarchaeales archaeon]
LAHPERIHGPEFVATLSAMDFVEPKDVRELRNEEVVELVAEEKLRDALGLKDGDRVELEVRKWK